MSGTLPRGPVFLVGCPRSGTTLLQRLLDAHPQVAIAPETFFVRRFWKRRREYGDLADDARFGRLIDDVVRLPEFAEMGLDAHAYRAAARAGRREIGELFRLLLWNFAAARGARLVGEKTPNHLLYMRTLQKFFAEALFIHIVRDPRAVVNSWRDVPWSNGSPAADAAIWRKYQRTAREKPPRGPGRIHTVRYEQLVAEPDVQLRAICDFIGLEFDPVMLDFHRAESPEVNVEREPWKRGTTRPIEPEAAERWLGTMTAAEIRAVEAVTWREMRRAGYEPVSRRLALLPAMVRAFLRGP